MKSLEEALDELTGIAGGMSTFSGDQCKPENIEVVVLIDGTFESVTKIEIVEAGDGYVVRIEV